MTRFVPVSFETHRTTRILNHPSERFGDNVGMLGVIPREFAMLVAHFPILFRKNTQSGRFEPAILLGFNAQENLFLAGERWDVAHVPLHALRQPFLIAPNAAGDDHVVMLDMDNPRVQEEAGEALFEPDGKPTLYLQRIMAVLRDLVAGTPTAYDYTAKLAEYGIIEPLRVGVQFVDHTNCELDGLYCVSAEKLQTLPGEKLVALRDLGYLPWAYFQIASLVHIGDLVARKNKLLSGIK